MVDYKNAFSEAWVILNSLEEEDLKKIPSEVLKTIELNRNLDYKYEIDDCEEIDLNKSKMLPETKALLFNIYRDYLATPEEKQKIIDSQREELMKREDLKREKYPTDIFKSKENKD